MIHEMDIRNAASKILEEKYAKLEELYEEIEIFELIVKLPEVTQELEDIISCELDEFDKRIV